MFYNHQTKNAWGSDNGGNIVLVESNCAKEDVYLTPIDSINP